MISLFCIRQIRLTFIGIAQWQLSKYDLSLFTYSVIKKWCMENRVINCQHLNESDSCFNNRSSCLWYDVLRTAAVHIQMLSCTMWNLLIKHEKSSLVWKKNAVKCQTVIKHVTWARAAVVWCGLIEYSNTSYKFWHVS